MTNILRSAPTLTSQSSNYRIVETDNQKIERVIGQVGINYSLKSSTVKNAYDKLWKALRFYMNQDSMPRIIVRNFGTFEPSLTQIEKEIKKIKTREIEGKDIKDKEKEGRLKTAKERVQRESETRRHPSGESGEIPASDGDLGDLS